MFPLPQKYKYKYSGTDESGDLGLLLTSSKYFVLACFMHNDDFFSKKFKKFIGKFNHKKNKKKILSLHDTVNSAEIQIADMFAWATFKKLEDSNDIYFKLLTDKIELVEIKI